MNGKTENPSGKLSAEALARSVFGSLGARRPEVLIGPAVGEDAAVIQWYGGKFIVFASDPIVGAAQDAGKLLVRVNVNDIASKGGEPAYITVTIISPPSMGEAFVSSLMGEIHEECLKNGIAIVGGHTEFNDLYDRPVLSAALIGTADRVFSAHDIRSGDGIYVTGHVGVEGMAILALDRPDLLRGILTEEEIASVARWMDETSVLEESRLLRKYASFMHDPTEGGFWGGLSEICRLSGLSAHIDADAVPIHGYTLRAARAIGFDPKRLVSSGSMIAVIGDDKAKLAGEIFEDSRIALTRVGRVCECPYAPEAGPPIEELWALLKRPRS
ncbi:MAG: hydrogenase expression protein [Synergistaceae bacterium]|nr:hydrogenase expression protein [Synergistaceae bacterium]